jgi:Ni/Co efflux regulator RcnB
MKLSAAIALALLLASPALAQGQGHGRGQGGGGGHGRDHSQQQHGQGHGGRIADADRSLIQGYFGQQFAQGNCPPGLAKKNNGCQPPGQARRWAVGQRLPDGLGYPLPPELLRRLAPPAGHTYMRVGTDILMIATGTGMVVSGLANLLQ